MLRKYIQNISGVWSQTKNLRLALRFLLGEMLPNLSRYDIMPLPLPRRTLAHSSLEGPQLRYSVQILDRLDRLRQKFYIRIFRRCLVQNRFQVDGIPLEMVRWTTEEALEFQPSRIFRTR